MNTNFKRMRYFAILLLIVIFAASAYAFAATNTVAASKAGDGTGTVSGYDITSVSYTLNSTDPTNIDQVSFTLDDTANDVYIQLDSLSGTWFSCAVVGTAATCDTSASTVPVKTLSELRVVAAN